VRQAYRDLALRLHPDRQTGATDAERSLAERRIREINQAWKVLGDRAARSRYDEALARATRVGPAAGPARPVPPPAGRAVRPSVDQDGDDLVDMGPDLGPFGSVVMRGLPWAAVLGVLLLIFVVTAYATGGRGQPSPTTIQTARVGSCVRVEPGPVAVGVDCGATGALRVVKRVDPLQGCPPGTELRRFQPDPVADCLAKSG